MAMDKQSLISSLQQSHNPYIKRLQNWTDNYNSTQTRGMDTRTGQRNVTPTVSNSNSLEDRIKTLEETANNNTTTDQDFWSSWIDQSQRDQYTAADYFLNRGREAATFHHNNQKDINEQTAGHTRDRDLMQMQENNVQRTSTSMDKWNELQSLDRRNTENSRGNLDVANIQANSNYNVAQLQADSNRETAAMQYQAQIEAARVSAEASSNNARLSAYSNLYANLATPKGDFRYW